MSTITKSVSDSIITPFFNMKIKNFLYLLALSGFTLWPVAFAQDGFDFTVEDNEGFTFTEEEVAAADAEDKDRALQSLITNSAKYVQAVNEGYSRILTRVTYCCRVVSGTKDLAECTEELSPAAAYNQTLAWFSSNYPVVPESGQFVERVMSRSTLAAAKRYLTPSQYAEIDHVISRSEAVAKWYFGSFKKACLSHNDDTMEIVQQTARFRDYIENQQEGRLADRIYNHLVKYFGSNAGSVSESSFARYNTLDIALERADIMPKEAPLAIQYFGSSPDSGKMDKWMNFIILGDDSSYSGPTFGLKPHVDMFGTTGAKEFITIRDQQTQFANTAKGAMMRSYFKYMEEWDISHLKSVTELGEYLRSDVENAFEEAEALSKVGGKDLVKTDAEFRELVDRHIPNMCAALVDKDDSLILLRKRLAENSLYMDNLNRTESMGMPLFSAINYHVKFFQNYFKRIKLQCNRYAK